MKKILFFTLGLLVAVTSFGQDSLVTDSTQGWKEILSIFVIQSFPVLN